MSTGPSEPPPGQGTPATDSARISGQVSDRSDPPWPPHPDDWRHDAPDPPEAFRVPWSWVDGIILAVWSLVAQALVAAVVVAAGYDPFKVGGSFWATVVGSEIVTVVGILAWLAARGVLSWRLLGPVRPAVRHVGIGVLVGLTGWLIVITLTLLYSGVFGPVESPQQEVLNAVYQGPLSALMGFLTAGVIAPIVEETIFRGLLFLALRGRAGLWPALVLSSFLFGLAHLLAPLWMVMLTVLGMWLAAAFHRYGSLVVPILGHAVFNTVMLTLALLAPQFAQR